MYVIREKTNQSLTSVFDLTFFPNRTRQLFIYHYPVIMIRLSSKNPKKSGQKRIDRLRPSLLAKQVNPLFHLLHQKLPNLMYKINPGGSSLFRWNLYASEI